ncbi:DOMON-like domain-containing protein [Oligoflexus tunisiensis]|uniref:DOMON-like domain-containing protein n=1 Tax=Oligoflexus tunisiensis TaxID=708132 RepID=UPI00114CA564|nr:DOMON-like domain-containing protein [Oligoflexus tunisiensis]
MEQLQPFAPTPAAAAFKILCDLDFRADVLELRYRVQGPIDDLALPMIVVNPQFRDELWTTTCLEIFLQEAGQPAYEEWNFSPSGNWAYYHFQSYRQPSGEAQRLQPLEPLLWIRNDHQLLLQVKIPLPQAFTTDRHELRYGLTAVLHFKSGEKQYWALHHAGDKPDFHRPESFLGEGRPN